MSDPTADPAGHSTADPGSRVLKAPKQHWGGQPQGAQWLPGVWVSWSAGYNACSRAKILLGHFRRQLS